MVTAVNWCLFGSEILKNSIEMKRSGDSGVHSAEMFSLSLNIMKDNYIIYIYIYMYIYIYIAKPAATTRIVFASEAG